MKKLLSQIEMLDYGITGTSLDKLSVKREQAALTSCGMPAIPEEVLSFLGRYNGFLVEGRCIFGIDVNKHFLYDILGENLAANNPSYQDILLLGATSGTYIGWACKLQHYLLIDKSTFMVLHTFKNFADAVRYILQIDD